MLFDAWLEDQTESGPEACRFLPLATHVWTGPDGGIALEKGRGSASALAAVANPAADSFRNSLRVPRVNFFLLRISRVSSQSDLPRPGKL